MKNRRSMPRGSTSAAVARTVSTVPAAAMTAASSEKDRLAPVLAKREALQPHLHRLFDKDRVIAEQYDEVWRQMRGTQAANMTELLTKVRWAVLEVGSERGEEIELDEAASYIGESISEGFLVRLWHDLERLLG